MESGDTVLKNHLSTSSKKATYIKNQNELIQLCRAQITKQITNIVKYAPYFAIIADKTYKTAHIRSNCVFACATLINPTTAVC